VLVVGVATAGLVTLASQATAVPSSKQGPLRPAGMSVSVDPASGDSTIDAWGLTPDSSAFVLVDKVWTRTVPTDGKGHVQTTIGLGPGTSRVAVCLDSVGESCPASTVVTRP